MNDNLIDQGTVTERLGGRTEMPVPAPQLDRGATNGARVSKESNQ